MKISMFQLLTDAVKASLACGCQVGIGDIEALQGGPIAGAPAADFAEQDAFEEPPATWRYGVAPALATPAPVWMPRRRGSGMPVRSPRTRVPTSIGV